MRSSQLLSKPRLRKRRIQLGDRAALAKQWVNRGPQYSESVSTSQPDRKILPVGSTTTLNTDTNESAIIQNQLYERWYRSNTVRTNKYTKCNFLPLNLFVQFSKVANIYFLFICAMQCIP